MTLEFNDILLYADANGKVKIDVIYEGETFWLSQKKIAELFDVSVPTINEHLQNIFKSKELDEISVIRKFLITAADGKNYMRYVTRMTFLAGSPVVTVLRASSAGPPPGRSNTNALSMSSAGGRCGRTRSMNDVSSSRAPGPACPHCGAGSAAPKFVPGGESSIVTSAAFAWPLAFASTKVRFVLACLRVKCAEISSPGNSGE